MCRVASGSGFTSGCCERASVRYAARITSVLASGITCRISYRLLEGDVDLFRSTIRELAHLDLRRAKDDQGIQTSWPSDRPLVISTSVADVSPTVTSVVFRAPLARYST